MCHLFGTLAVVSEHANPYPPISDRATELLNFGGVIAARKMACQASCFFFGIEGADLHGPSTSVIKSCRCLQYFQSNRCSSRLPHIYFFGGGQGQIDDAAFHKRSAIGNAHDGGMTGLHVRDSND